MSIYLLNRQLTQLPIIKELPFSYPAGSKSFFLYQTLIEIKYKEKGYFSPQQLLIELSAHFPFVEF